MKKLLAFLLATIMVLSLTACVVTDPNTGSTGTNPSGTTGEVVAPPQKGGHLDFVFSAQPNNLDPAKSTGVFHYMWTSLVWEAPLTRDANGAIRPNVCEFELSEDQLTLKLWVREGMTFHDGSAVEIEDVVASLKRAVHKSPRQFVSAYIKDVVIENGVATITFTEYNEKTMYYIACPNAFIGVMPKEIAEKYSYESGEIITSIEDAIGTGPYKIIDFETGVSVAFERYEGYKPVAEGYTGFAAPKMAYLDSITFWAKGDENAAYIALMNGQYDLCEGVSSDYYPQLEAAGIVNMSKSTNTTLMLSFNTFREGGLVSGDNDDMRKAILAAIDVPELVEVALFGRYDTWCCPVQESQYYTDLFKMADYMGEDNIELSKKYQKAAGYNGEPLQIVYNEGYLEHFTLLCDYLTAAGINYEAKMLENEALQEIINDKQGAWDINFSYPSFSTSPGQLSSNIMSTNYNSAAKDKLVGELGKLYAGTEEYKAKWLELAQLMVDECAVAFLGQCNLVWSHDPDFHLEYDGMVTYLFNSYWENPSEHMD